MDDTILGGVEREVDQGWSNRNINKVMSNSGGILKRVEANSTENSPVVVARRSLGLSQEQIQSSQKAGRTDSHFQPSPLLNKLQEGFVKQ